MDVAVVAVTEKRENSATGFVRLWQALMAGAARPFSPTGDELNT